jgi:hypothetical protein
MGHSHGNRVVLECTVPELELHKSLAHPGHGAWSHDGYRCDQVTSIELVERHRRHEFILNN